MDSQAVGIESQLRASGPPEGGPARPRKKFTAGERREIVSAWESSGLGAEEYAQQLGTLHASTLYAWRRRVQSGDLELGDRPNPRNAGRRTRGRYAPEERRRIVEAFQRSGLARREFARVWGLALNTLCQWLKRYEQSGPKGLEPLPPGRKKGDGPRKISSLVRAEVARTKTRFPDFGLRKVKDFLWRFHGLRVSTGGVRSVLDEAGIERAVPARRVRRKPAQPRRFERAHPMELWQTDITSFVLARHSRRVYLTVFLDDASRYVVSFALHLHQRSELVVEALLEGIARYGKPKEVLTDQGRQYYAWRGKSDFEKLLEREGIEQVVSRAHHPETLGKCERLWETVEREFWGRARPDELVDARERLGHFFAHYNFFRPHQGIGGLVPADRFFGAEEALRKTLEARLAQNELELSLERRPRGPVFLFGQIGDQQVSLIGEQGRLVLHTGDGDRREIELDQIESAREGQDGRDGRHDEQRGGGGGRERRAEEADAARGEAGALQAPAAPGGGGEGPAGGGERGGEGARAVGLSADPGAVAGPQDEGRGGEGAEPAAGARVADEPDGALGDDRGAAQAAAVLVQGGGAGGIGTTTASGCGGPEEGDPEAEHGAGSGAQADGRAEAAREREGLGLDAGDGGELERKKKGESSSRGPSGCESAGSCEPSRSAPAGSWEQWLERWGGASGA